MKQYEVTLPIAGHAYLTVEAESPEKAIEMALEEVKEVDSWEALKQFHQGNICHCPRPWKAEAELIPGDDE